MFRLIPLAFELQVYQLCLCWELLPEHLCYGYRHSNDISGKRKHLLSTGHCLTFLFSLLCLLQLLDAQATWILQDLLAQCGELVLAEEMQKPYLMCTGHEYFQNLTEEVCRWRLTVMEVLISVFWLTQNWFPLGKACYEDGLTPPPRSPWDGFIPLHPLLTPFVSVGISLGKCSALPGSLGRVGGSAFYRKRWWCLGIRQKFWVLIPKTRESPNREGKEWG